MPDETFEQAPANTPKTTRASVSFPRELYETLELLARQKKVSVAWVVREAAESYVAAQWPLFADSGEGAEHRGR